MVVIYDEGEFYVKYEVFLNKEELKRIKKELIENCSVINHLAYNTTILPNKKEREHIKNYIEYPVNMVENEYWTEQEYRVEYDYYKYHPLVELVALLLKGEVNAIKEIEEFEDENIKEINNNQDLLNSLDINKLNTLKALLYKSCIINCIHLKEVSRVSKLQVKEINEFFNTGLEIFVEKREKTYQK